MLPDNTFSLYVHFPWCKHKCPYCDFNSHKATAVIPQTEYIDKIIDDLAYDLARFPFLQNKKLSTIFIGGGTPNLFSADNLANCMERIKKLIPNRASDLEVTIEINPSAVAHCDFAVYKQAGINRISIGGQTFDKQGLLFLERDCSKNNIITTIENALLNFAKVNVDLMFGFYKQTPQSALKDLSMLMDLGIKHISWYQFSLEPNSVFYSNTIALASDDAITQTINRGLDLLQKNNFQRYEISAFAHQSQAKNNSINHMAKHNLNYWSFGDYLGIGAGACGKVTDLEQNIIRTKKTRHPKDYLLPRAISHINQDQRVKDEEKLFEFLLNNLRLASGVSKIMLEKHTNTTWQFLLDKLSKYIKQKLFVVQNNTLLPTPLGWQCLDSVLEEFIVV